MRGKRSKKSIGKRNMNRIKNIHRRTNKKINTKNTRRNSRRNTRRNTRRNINKRTKKKKLSRKKNKKLKGGSAAKIEEKNAFREFEIISGLLSEDINYSGLSKPEIKERLSKTLELKQAWSTFEGRVGDNLRDRDSEDIIPAIYPTFAAVLDKIMTHSDRQLCETALLGLVRRYPDTQFHVQLPEFPFSRTEIINIPVSLIKWHLEILEGDGIDPKNLFSKRVFDEIGKSGVVKTQQHPERQYGAAVGPDYVPFNPAIHIDKIKKIEQERFKKLETTERGKLAAAKLRLIIALVFDKQNVREMLLAEVVHGLVEGVKQNPEAIEHTLRRNLEPSGLRRDMTPEEKIQEYGRLIRENPQLTEFYEKAKARVMERQGGSMDPLAVVTGGGSASTVGAAGGAPMALTPVDPNL